MCVWAFSIKIYTYLQYKTYRSWKPAEKKGVRRDPHQNVCNNTNDQMLYIILLGKPGGLISLYMASIRQWAPFCYCARITKLYTRDTSETAVHTEGLCQHCVQSTKCQFQSISKNSLKACAQLLYKGSVVVGHGRVPFVCIAILCYISYMVGTE